MYEVRKQYWPICPKKWQTWCHFTIMELQSRTWYINNLVLSPMSIHRNAEFYSLPTWSLDEFSDELVVKYSVSWWSTLIFMFIWKFWTPLIIIINLENMGEVKQWSRHNEISFLSRQVLALDGNHGWTWLLMCEQSIEAETLLTKKISLVTSENTPMLKLVKNLDSIAIEILSEECHSLSWKYLQ